LRELCVKVFNSFVEKFVEIAALAANSGREYCLKCSLHHICAERIRFAANFGRGREIS